MAKLFSEETNEGRGRALWITLFFAALIAGAYIHGIRYYQTRFLPGSIVDGVEIGDMRLEEAEAALSSREEDQTLILIRKDGTKESVDIHTAVPKRNYAGLSEVLKGQDSVFWIYSRNFVKELFLPYEGAFDEEGLREALLASDTLDPSSERPQNARIVLDSAGDGYVILPETEGNTVLPDPLMEAAREAIQKGQKKIDLKLADCYQRPELYRSDAGLNARLAELNTLQGLHFTMDLGADVYEGWNGEELYRLITGEASAAKEVAALKKKYDTSDSEKSRIFHSQSGRYVVLHSNYGWNLDEEKTLDLMNTALQHAAETIGRSLALDPGAESDTDSAAPVPAAAGTEEPENPWQITAAWKSRGAVHHFMRDYGTTYAEADLKEQKVYMVVDGECVLESPCVSGRMTKDRMTPEGIFAIRFKQTNKVLTGYKPDGSIDYQSPVSYWMPFYNGIGFHDATWRGAFGGTIYVSSGSHGCVNLPLAKARELYGIVYKDMPVIVHY